jgi:hypothetical protein
MRRPEDLSRSEILGRFAGVPSKERNSLLLSASMLLLAAQMVLVFPAIFWLGRFAKFDEASHFVANALEAGNGLWLVALGYLFSVSALGVGCWVGFKARRAIGPALAGAAICALAVLAALVWTVHMWSGTVSTDRGIFLYRYLQIGSGVSPCLPLLFLVGAWLWWCWQSLSGVASTKEKHMVLPKMSDFDTVLPPEGFAPARKLEPAERVRLKALAAGRSGWPWTIMGSLPLDWKTVASALAGFAVICLLMRPDEIAEAFESPAYKRIYWVLLYSCLLLVCYVATQIVSLWLEFRTQLRAIENVPFRRGFSDLKNLTWKPLWKLAGSGREQFLELLVGEVDALNKIQNAAPTNERLQQTIQDANIKRNLLSQAYEPVLDQKSRPVGDVQELFFDFQNTLATCASEALMYANGQWKHEKYEEPQTKDQDKDDGKDKDKDKEVASEPPAADPAIRAVEYFLCLFYLNIILIPLRRLQTLILAMAGVFVFVLISYSSYPFESRESFHALLISIFFAISLVVAIVYGQMYSNPLLSRITNTKPGELGLDFWVRLGAFVFVPLLSLLSVQFPELNNFFFSWLQPALQSIK